MTSKMPIVTIGYGSLLILVGVIGYFGTGAESMTALIPAFLGIPVEALGVLALKERFLKHAMHGAAVIGLLGLLGTLRGVLQLPAYFAGTAERPAAVLSQSATAFLSLVFLVLCVRSFIEARRAREAGV